MSKAQGIAQSANQGQFKNRLINSDMRIDQRNAGASVNNTGASPYTLDRWVCYGPTSARFSVQQNAGGLSGTNLPTGFRNYLGATSLASTSLGASDDYVIAQYVEGFNMSDLMWGTVNASSVTLSFWVRSSLTGTFGGALQNGGAARSYVFSYNISAANTWEYKTITIAGDTTGTWLTTNGTGIGVVFSLGSGTSKSTTAGSWVNGNINGVTGGTSVVGTNGATFYITGVQLEKGSTATSFDYRPYGTELSLCQRYYEKSYDIGVVPGTIGVAGNWTTVGNNTYPRVTTRFTVEKRTTPTMTFYADSDGTTGNLNVWDSGTVRRLSATNIFITSKLTSPEGDYGSVLSVRSFLYYNWTASAEL